MKREANEGTTMRKIESHPVRVRGLKLIETIEDLPKDCVAPRAGAWVETL